ncbi:tRNA-guanine transglycosylase [Dendronalium sp. ChiSLP03b]|uniref:tRNA-guanine transglycosylase n=1 Tax=Dendronalium sp. ChiSLP03b TaxID=3075381 RepID=UPI002AD56FD6|nr:tRNA-guanine transglycosylase [Dendronalium sp. ChiSLP03b]MDZ8207215.1 tRNA-guanine transglycosylase [Dendronalium sp. ChiSLP03b]
MVLVKFSVKKVSQHGRTGRLCYKKHYFDTPLLFPVVSLVTGTTAKGGGLWKYILQMDQSNSLLRRNLPVLSQVLHFLDFIPNKKNSLASWRKLGIKRRYSEEVFPPVKYTAPLFLDSGGFKLLWNNSIDLSAYGLSMEDGQGFQSILKLQQNFGGDIIATLDYPLPPKLAALEAKERMNKSLDNAISAALSLQKPSQWKPFLYVAAHGQDRDNMSNYVKQVFDNFQREDLREYPFGLAVGSLVPLRGSNKNTRIIELIRGLQESIPENRQNITPIHVFGITGSLIPILAYFGVDSFDSSSYVQETRSLSYINPETMKPQPVLEMEELTCDCRICQKANLEDIQNALISEVSGQPVHNGHYKSKYYADIALHNLEMDFRIVDKTREAIKADCLQEYLIEYTKKFPNLQPVMDAIATEDIELKIRLSRTLISVPKKQEFNNNEQVISLKYKPDDFNIMNNGYAPLSGKHIMLIIPCSAEKPYSNSRSHRFITKRIEKVLGDVTTSIDKVTLSGLYGPVPEKYEAHEAVMRYDFLLDPLDKAQISLVTERLVNYLKRHSHYYHACIGYATSKAYRTVLEQAAQEVSYLQVLPVKPKSRRMTEFFRKENVAELVEQVNLALNNAEVSPE